MKRQSEREWDFVTYGTSVDTVHNGYSGSVEENNLSVWSLNGRGKLVPASTDGLAFYYTVMDPKTENFTISADITVENWTYSNGQDGFGILVCDSIGQNGEEESFWNNSYMAAVTKISYCYDQEKQRISDTGEQYDMNLGICAREKKGITPEAVAQGRQVQAFSTSAVSLEALAAEKKLPPGSYNIVGAYTNEKGALSDIDGQTLFHLKIRRDNSGYVVSYIDAQGKETSKRYYREEGRDQLTCLDNKRIYAGFFASRNAKISVRNVELTTILPEEDEAPVTPPLTYVTTDFHVESAPVANKEEYRLLFYGNAQGVLHITNSVTGECIASGESVKAFTKVGVRTRLRGGENVFDICFTPDEAYRPSCYERLSSYEPVKLRFAVRCYEEAAASKIVFIHPEGKPEGEGTREAPVDLYTAVGRAVPGQKLFLLGGTYRLERPVKIEPGMDGRPEAPILLTAAPGENSRPVFDFGKKSKGMILCGNWWHFKGFDVTRTVNAGVGIHLCGSNNTMEEVKIYRNGNTGLQISRYRQHDSREEWPGNNLILNCTSYLNADPGYTDSDGFAAKLSVREGNVFDGCISAYNADDGFDLFAKVERGVIGPVTIQNCIAFKNGYVIDENGKEAHRGLGNGFKLGGSSLPAKHVLKNSVAFGNGEKGIDSNSCPDARVYHCISYNNDSHNVALFTTDARDTDFYARGILSFKDCNRIPEQLEGKGTQEDSNIYDESNYYFDGEKSVNVLGKQLDESWFVSLDMEKAIHGGICRNSDGSIRRNGFLELLPEVMKEWK